MSTFGDLSKYKQNASTYAVPSYVAKQKHSLTDLRKDEEFNKVTERFLTSLGEGETVGDLFGYFRGADYNLGDATKMVFESGKFNQQQKTDYQYLRNKFDNADVGGFGEWVRAGANVTKEIITDPTMIASALFIPWTGGTSAAARIAAGKAVQTTLKKLANKEIAEGVSKGVAKLPGQTLKTPMSKNAKTVVAGTEGFIYGSTANFTKQHADVNTDRREEIKPEESLAMGAITAAIPAVFRGAGAGYTKFNKSITDRRAAKIDGNEDYKVGIIDKGIEKTDAIVDYVTPNMRKLTGFVNKPTSMLLEKMEASPKLDKIVKYFRYDAARSITAKDYNVSKKVSNRSFYEDVNSLIGFRGEQLRSILDPLKTKGKVMVPKLGSRDAFFKIPFKETAKAERQSFFKRQRIADNVNDALAYYLRTGRKTVTVDGKQIKLEKAFKLTDKSTDDIITAGQSIKKLMTEIRNDAKKEGLEIGLIKNYLPRGFSYGEVKSEIKNLEKGIEGKLVKELKAKEGLKTNEEVITLLEEIINPSTVTGKSYTELATVGKGATRGAYFSKRTPGLTKERTLKNIDENNIVDYLDNNVENLLNDYIHQSSNFIQRKAGLGEDLDEFITRFVNPIKEELAAKGKKLSSQEYKRLEDIYLVTTGQVQQIDNVIGRTLSDIAVVGNQLALLPMATITSLSEVAVPLVRGAGKKSFQKGKTESGVDKGGVRILWETAGDYRKMWWNDVVKKDISDARPDSLKELNRFNRAMNRAGEDRSLAMYGQGFGRRATQAQNKFFKINLLHDWTRFVQLTSFNVGKAKMYENLHELTTTKKISTKRKIRLTNELKELGVDVTSGKRWVKSGGKASGKFYDENFLPSAARYVDEVIMNPTAASNQKPLWHSMPSTRWAFGLMGFPTAFSNTVLKNAAREIAIDVKTGSLKGTGQAVSGVTAMTSIAMFGNTIRSNGKNLEDLESGEKDIGDEVLDAAIRTGLLGPTEQLYRTQKGLEYDNFARSITQRFTGPAVDDILRFFDDWTGPLSFGVDEVPGIALLRSTNPEAYKEIKSAAKEADKALGLTRKTKTKEKEEKVYIPLYSTGGIVKGKDDVPYTKEDPSDRVDSFTGKPYSDQMTRVGLADGGMPKPQENKINVYFYLREKGLKHKAIVGIMANIGKETYDTYSYKTQQKDGPGYGLFQLDPGGDHVKQYNMFLERKKQKDSMESQIDYFLESIYDTKSPALKSNGVGNAKNLRNLFDSGTVKEITQGITEKWERPDDYLKREKNPKAWNKNLKDRQVRANKLNKEVNIFNEQFDFVSQKDLRYLPTNANRIIDKFTKVKGKVYLPKKESDSFNREITAERMSERALRNDPQGKGFHGGDPEYDPRVVTGDPSEIRGREGLDKYGTRPKIYRAIDPVGAIFHDKYTLKNMGQFDKGSPAIRGGYMKYTDELLLSSTKNNSMKKNTEPHEYMHRGLLGKGLTSDQEHDYIDEVFEKKEMKEFKDKIENMDMEELIKYREKLS
jgi:hypothetical protein